MQFLQSTPFFRVLAPFLFGILFSIFTDFEGKHFDFLIIFLSIILLILLNIKGIYKYKWFFGIILSSFIFLSGSQITYYHDELNKKSHFSNYDEDINEILGIVSKAGDNKNKTKVIIEVKRILLENGNYIKSTGNILLYLTNEMNRKISYGDILSIKGKITAIPPLKNPKAFDYKSYLHFKNINYQGFISENNWKIKEKEQKFFILQVMFKFRENLISILKKHLKTEDEIAVGSALILGYKNDITNELKDAYASTGAIHILAVSGLHVGIIYFILLFLFKPIGTKKILGKLLKTLSLILGIWAFALLTGGSPSVLRASTMFSFIIIGNNFRKITNIYNTLALSAFFLLMINPYLIMDVGFQLSYSAVIGIVFFYTHIYNIFEIKNFAVDYIWKLTSVSIAAQLSTLPLVLFYFHRFPVYFWLSGLIVIPAALIILSNGFLLFFLELTVPALAKFFGLTLFYTIKIVNYSIFAIKKLPFSTFENIWITPIVTLLLIILIIAIGFSIVNKIKKYKFLPLYFTILLLAIIISVKHIQNKMSKKIVIYDVYKNTIIDFFDGQKLISLTNRNIPEKKIKYSAQSFRLFNKIDSTQNIEIKSQEVLRLENFYKNGIFINFYKNKLAIIDKNFYGKVGNKVIVDFLLIRNSPCIKIQELKKFFIFDSVIFDSSNYPSQIIKWKKECKQLDIQWKNTKENAVIISI